DIDGTLLRAAGSGRAAMQLAMIEVFGTAGDIAAYTFAGKTDLYMLTELLRPEGISPEQIADNLSHYGDVLTQHMERIASNYQIKALPGTLDLVDMLADHVDVVLGLLTGNMPGMADLKLRAAGFDPAMFAVRAYGSEARLRDELGPLALTRADAYTGE